MSVVIFERRQPPQNILWPLGLKFHYQERFSPCLARLCMLLRFLWLIHLGLVTLLSLEKERSQQRRQFAMEVVGLKSIRITSAMAKMQLVTLAWCLCLGLSDGGERNIRLQRVLGAPNILKQGLQAKTMPLALIPSRLQNFLGRV